jgi:lysophospholipase L1-like esterase
MRETLVLLLLSVAALGEALPSRVASSAGNTVSHKRVLFIGNSLTEANDLPTMTQVLAESLPHLRIHVEAVTLSGASLEDHWKDGTAIKKVRQERWDIVVLQQGPSSLPESRANLIRWSERFAKIIRDAGGTTALFMVWPPEANSDRFDSVRDSYKAAAEKTRGIFLPAGDAWRAAWRRNPALALYGPDGFHPSARGSYLSALVIVGSLCNCSVRDLPSQRLLGLKNGQSLDIPESEALVLKQAADEVVLQRRRE